MSRHVFKPTAMVIAWALILAAPARSAPPSPWKPSQPGRPGSTPTAPSAQAGKPLRWIDDQPDTGQFLPDTVLLARVADRTIRVADYVSAYFLSYAEFRPRPDSAGRVEFLHSMINKDVLGLTALEINRPLGFEDRHKIRENRQRVLSNALFQRYVIDSLTVTEDEMRELYKQYQYALRLRHIQFADRGTAERVRRELTDKRIAWKDAVRRYSVAPDSDRVRDGDLGWRSRLGFHPGLAYAVFALKPGQMSPVLQTGQMCELFQALERRPDNPPYFENVRLALHNEIRSVKIDQRAGAIQALLRDEIGMSYDTTNIEWASSHFSPTQTTGTEGRTATMTFNVDLPEFTPADTTRVLARHRYGRFTLGGLLESYHTVSALVRPNLTDFESMRTFVDGVVLEPYKADLAVKRGLERDSLVILQLERQREQILVEHLYEDSITSKIWIRPQDRRQYYQKHLSGFFTYPSVKFAGFVHHSRAGADSIAARLRAGEKAEDLLRADSLAGRTTGSIQGRSQSEKGMSYHKLLFEELRPGRVAIEGPDQAGDYAVIQLLSYDPGRQLAYEEVESIIDESMQNIRAEEMLKEFLARHRKRYRIVARPELLGRVALVDRAAD